MRKKLDSENLGIILLNAFMDEFFPKEESSTPDMFSLYHYNGLPHSNVHGRVKEKTYIYKTTILLLLFSGAVSCWFSNSLGIGFKVNM